jgi:hypothetical protein
MIHMQNMGNVIYMITIKICDIHMSYVIYIYIYDSQNAYLKTYMHDTKNIYLQFANVYDLQHIYDTHNL